jgi:outer membrane protein assembly factor BamD
MRIGKLAGSIFAAVLAMQLAACGSMWGDKKELSPDTPPDKLFAEANALLDKSEWTKAAERFEEVDRQHPYAQEARRAIVMAAYAYEKAGKSVEAVAAARRYIAMHPGTKEAALAQHIITSCYFDRINDPKRDQTDTKKAVTELETLIRRYPDSQYVETAKRRLKLSRDVLAGSEMDVARYYQKQGNFLAAVNRYKSVVTDYQSTAHVEEALMRLTECYLSLGIVNEAQTAAAVLGHNFPESKWYKESYALLKGGGLEPHEDSGSWISRTWKKAVHSVQG